MLSINCGLNTQFDLKILFSLLTFLFPFILVGQSDSSLPREVKSLKISRAIDKIVVDGLLDEETWKQAEKGIDFHQKSPRDDLKAALDTEFSLSYDDDFLYVSAKCYDSGSNYVVPTLKRDEAYWNADAVALIIDPLNEASSGFMFGTSSHGVQNDVLLGGGSGSGNYNDRWDNRWFAETKRYAEYWTAEMAIPFKSIRYKSGNTTWGINFLRNDKKNNRHDVWSQIPAQFWYIDLGYTGQLEWDSAPKEANGNINIIPYVKTAAFKDHKGSLEADYSYDAGVDAKIALSSALNLDLTVNPDFSQVEVDQQVTNLTRFSIFLPERRTFFLENSDIFSRVGYPSVQPFFSRRIGLDDDGNAVPILFGARLTGNVTNTTRIGLLNVQTKATTNQLAQNYTAATFSQRVFKRSRMQGMFINRQAFSKDDLSADDYGRNLSLKFNYLSEDSKFEFWSAAHKSFKPEVNGDDMFFENGLSYSGKNLAALFVYVFVDNNYYADTGFINMVENYDAEKNEIVRLGYHLLTLPISFTFFPENSKFANQHRIEYEGSLNLDPEGSLVERTNELSYELSLRNSSELSVSLAGTTTDLRFPFTFTGGTPLPKDRYTYQQVSFEYQSDERKFFQYELGVSGGSFYNGNLTSAALGLLYRVQPWGNFGAEIEYNKLSFPGEYGERSLWSVSPRVEISFNRYLFLTTFMQYNTQANNFNINSRFQWRVAPMSDLFLVYTDNYDTMGLTPKNRAVVLKFNYWIVL